MEMKLARANRDLELQRKRTHHFQKLNQFAWRKLKATQEKLKEAKGKCPTRKEEKGISALDVLASASKHVARDP